MGAWSRRKELNLLSPRYQRGASTTSAATGLAEILLRYSKNTALGVDLQISAAQLKKALLKPSAKRRSVVTTGRVGKAWKVSDRLSEEEMLKIVKARSSGVPIIKVAEQFGISHSSVKRIMRMVRLGTYASAIANLP